MNAVPGRAATISPLPVPRRVDPSVVLAGGGCAVAAVLGALAANHPAYWRLTLAVALAANLLIVASRWPRAAALLTLLFLPFLALVRRLLIQDAGWTQYDPLLLVAPAVAIFLVARLFLLERRPLASGHISKLVVALLALMLLQSFNPMLGSITAGAGGFMFLGVPLLWFFIGREVADRRLVMVLLYCVVALAVAIGAYGLLQTEVSMPSWDSAWVDLNGYQALSVYGVTRAFGTFSSSAEYGIFLGGAVAISAAMLVHRRAIFALTIPFLVVPMFLASGRGVIMLAVLAALVAVGLRTRNTRLALVIVVVGLAAAAVGLRSYGSGSEAPSSSSNPLVTHQVSGLSNPLDPEHSTLLVHIDLVIEGLKQGIVHPFGQGTAVTNIAADRFGIGSSAKGTEVDVSNAFVSLGLIGGLLFLAIVIATFRGAVTSYFRHPDPALLAIIVFLIVMAGQWLNGGYYALAPLTWFFIGWATSHRPRERV
jgi:hypothetical protein